MRPPVLIAFVILAGAVPVGCGGSGPGGFTVNDQGFLDNIGKGGAVLDGYDMVVYMEQNRALKGTEEFRVRHQGSVYLFSSGANRDRFNDNPTAYTPQFGGFCAMAAARGELKPADPEVFTSSEGQLLVFGSGEAASAWRQDPSAHLAAARAHWPGLVAEAKRRTAMGG